MVARHAETDREMLERDEIALTTTGPVLPLAGIKVLDFSQFLAGPSCALRLADLGADVIKIERPETGDACRQLQIAGQSIGADSVLFHTINRNKRSVTADLKAPSDLRKVEALIRSADVMIHNFRPGVMERIGLGCETVQALNPRLIYAAVTGYGSTGPWRDKPGQDLLAQSMSGLAWLSGDAGQGPVPTGVPITDILTGAHLAQGILAALLRRTVTGLGGQIDVSLMESALDLQFELTTAYLRSNASPQRSAVNNAGAYSAAPYGIYRSADGHLAIAMTPIDRLGRLIGCDVLTGRDDPEEWFARRDEIKAALRDHLVGMPTRHWLALLEPADIWCAEVMNYQSLMATDGFVELDMLQETTTSRGDRLRTTRCPIRIDGRKLFSSRGAPALGADTEAVWSSLAKAEPAGSSASQ